MLTTSLSQDDEYVASLRAQLSIAQSRLERAELFVYDLRCLAAKKNGRAFWAQERDASGLRRAYGGVEGGGHWEMIKSDDIPTPTHILPLLVDLFAELSFPLPSSAQADPPPFPADSKHFPPELFYHVADHCSPSTLSILCRVSSSVRAIASPILYHSMSIKDAARLRPFSPHPSNPLAPFNRSITLDKVVSLHLVISCGYMPILSLDDHSYPPVQLPALLHLSLEPRQYPRILHLSLEPRQYPRILQPYLSFLAVAQALLPLLNPQTVTALRDGAVDYSGPYSVDEELWSLIGRNWGRLEAVRFVDCSWVFDDPFDEWGIAAPFFPTSSLSIISFTWVFTSASGGYRSSGGGHLAFLEGCRVFEHPSVRARGIELLVGDRPEARKAVAYDLKDLPEELRGFVRY